VGSPPIRVDDKEELRETRSMKYTVVTGFEFPDSTDEESNTGAEIFMKDASSSEGIFVI
jgi:hypothetical protein